MLFKPQLIQYAKIFILKKYYLVVVRELFYFNVFFLWGTKFLWYEWLFELKK